MQQKDATALNHALQKNVGSLFEEVRGTELLDEQVNREGLGQAFAAVSKQVRPEDVFRPVSCRTWRCLGRPLLLPAGRFPLPQRGLAQTVGRLAGPLAGLAVEHPSPKKPGAARYLPQRLVCGCAAGESGTRGKRRHQQAHQGHRSGHHHGFECEPSCARRHSRPRGIHVCFPQGTLPRPTG